MPARKCLLFDRLIIAFQLFFKLFAVNMVDIVPLGSHSLPEKQRRNKQGKNSGYDQYRVVFCKQRKLVQSVKKRSSSQSNQRQNEVAVAEPCDADEESHDNGK